MDADLDTLATALYVKIDDLLKAAPQWAPARPPVGIAPTRGPPGPAHQCRLRSSAAYRVVPRFQCHLAGA